MCCPMNLALAMTRQRDKVALEFDVRSPAGVFFILTNGGENYDDGNHRN
ncbi:hypothetical protein LAV79_05305 [Peribacillus butanolivorans]